MRRQWQLGIDGIYQDGKLCSMMYLVSQLNKMEEIVELIASRKGAKSFRELGNIETKIWSVINNLEDKYDQ